MKWQFTEITNVSSTEYVLLSINGCSLEELEKLFTEPATSEASLAYMWSHKKPIGPEEELKTTLPITTFTRRTATIFMPGEVTVTLSESNHDQSKSASIDCPKSEQQKLAQINSILLEQGYLKESPAASSSEAGDYKWVGLAIVSTVLLFFAFTLLDQGLDITNIDWADAFHNDEPHKDSISSTEKAIHTAFGAATGTAGVGVGAFAEVKRRAANTPS